MSGPFSGGGEPGGRPARTGGATLKDTMVRAGQSAEKAALIQQHSERERQGSSPRAWTGWCGAREGTTLSSPLREEVVRRWRGGHGLVDSVDGPGR